MNCNIKLSENVSLLVKVTPQLWEDYQECGQMAMIPGGSGKDCSSCRLSTGMDIDLCEIDIFTDFLERMVLGQAAESKDGIKDPMNLCEADAKISANNYG